MRNMNNHKMKGRMLNKKEKNNPTIEMEATQTSSDKKVVSKKRKHDGADQGIVALPLKKKSKRKQTEDEEIHNHTSEANFEINVEQENKVSSNKKVRKKVDGKKNQKSELNVENAENIKEQINAKVIPSKTKKKAKICNESVLNTNISVENETYIPSSEKIIQPTTKNNKTPLKKRKKRTKNQVPPIATQNGDIGDDTDVSEPHNISSITGNAVIKHSTTKKDILSNAVNSISDKFEIDIEERSLTDVKSETEPILYNSLNNNDKEVKREVNVIDIKSEGGEENTENIVTISIRDVDGANTNEDEDELLKQLERKLKPKTCKETIDWPEADLRELLGRMEKCIPPNDIKPFTRRLEQLEWESITFKNYSIEDCRNMWFKLQKKIRKYRVLNEVLQDAKSWVQNNESKSQGNKKKGRPQKHPDMPRKPLTAYFLFYLENRDSYLTKYPGVDAAEVSKALAQIFQSLPAEEKKKYELISLQKKEEYHKKLDEFYRTHPEIPRSTKEIKTKAEKPVKPPKPVKEKPPPKPPKEKVPVKPHPPFHYFYVAELEKENVEDKTKFKEICKERWKQLPERNKLVWIHYAEAELAKYEEEIEEYIKKHPEHVKNPLKPILSKEDLQIKDRAAGKPSKPPGSAYNLFASKLLQSDEIKNVPVRDRLIFVSNQWKYCSEEEKKYYRDLYIEHIKKYNEEYTAYLETLPEDEKKKELMKSSIKKIKIEGEKKEPKKKKEVTRSMSKRTVPKSVSSQKLVQQIEKLKEPQQPPISPFKYFLSIYSGDEPVVQAWKTLTKEQKKIYEEELLQKKKDYIRDFEKFLKSLTEEELEEFSKSRQKAKEEKQDNEDEESDSYDSDESSDEDEDEEANQEHEK